MKSKSNYVVILLGVLFLLLLLGSCKPSDKPTSDDKKSIPAKEHKLETAWAKTLDLNQYAPPGTVISPTSLKPVSDGNRTYLTYDIVDYSSSISNNPQPYRHVIWLQPVGYMVFTISNANGKVLWVKKSTEDVLAGEEEEIAPRLTRKNELELALINGWDDAKSLHYLYLNVKNGKELFERKAYRRIDQEPQNEILKNKGAGFIKYLSDEKSVRRGYFSYYEHSPLNDPSGKWDFKLGDGDWDIKPPESDGEIILLKYFRKKDHSGREEKKYAVIDEDTGKLLIKPSKHYDELQWPILLPGKKLFFIDHRQAPSESFSSRLMMKKIKPVADNSPAGRLYLRYWQGDNIFEVNENNGDILKKIPVKAPQSGVEVSPDGRMIFFADFDENNAGRLRIINADNYRLIQTEALPDLVPLLGGEPISLSGDGRWLLISRFIKDPKRKMFMDENTPIPTLIYDTSARKFLVSTTLVSGEGEAGVGSETPGIPETIKKIEHCKGNPTAPELIGRSGYDLLFMACKDSLVALRSKDLKIEWTKPIFDTQGQSLAFDSYSNRLYLMRPQIKKTEKDTLKVLATDILMTIFDASSGKQISTAYLRNQTSVPLATVGRGDQGYLEISPDGSLLYAVWEDRLWLINALDLVILQEIVLPAPGEEISLSPDGERLYIIPASSGDLKKRGKEVWIFDTVHTRMISSLPFDLPESQIPNKIISAPN